MIKNLQILLLTILYVAIIGCHHSSSKINETHEIIKDKQKQSTKKPETKEPIHLTFLEIPPQIKICQKKRCIFQTEPISILTLNGIFQDGKQKTAFIQDTVEPITQIIKIGDVLGDEYWVVKDITLSSVILKKSNGDKYLIKM